MTLAEFDLDFKAFLRRHPDFTWRTTAILVHCDVPNRRGHIYPSHVMERAVREYAQRHNSAPLFGYMDHESGSLSNLAVLVKNIKVANGVVQGELKPLDTPSGLKFGLLLEAGAEFTLSICGSGRLVDNVVEDYRLESVVVRTNGPARS